MAGPAAARGAGAQPPQGPPAQVQPGRPDPADAPGEPEVREDSEDPEASDGPASGRAAGAPPQHPQRPVVRVTGDRHPERPLRVVERALRSQPGKRHDGWRERVVIVPGGHRPGKPDQLQRDRARARLPISGPRRIVILGCTRGAGQTMTALLAADMLAALRAEAVAVLDLNPGRGSLTERASAIPGLVQEADGAPAPPGLRQGGPGGEPAGGPGLQVISAGTAARGGDEAGRLLDLVAARYPLTLADPAAGCVPRTLEAADQLLIVAPASAEAANALAMTFEWLEAHGHRRLADGAITVVNGVSKATAAHAEHAVTVASGRCRAIVKVPWDSQLKSMSARPARPAAGAAAHDAAVPGQPALAAPVDPRGASALSPALAHAYTALAGVLVASLADPGELRSARG